MLGLLPAPGHPGQGLQVLHLHWLQLHLLPGHQGGGHNQQGGYEEAEPFSVKRNARRKHEFLKIKSVSSEESSNTSEKKLESSDKESVTPEKNNSDTPEKAVKTTVDLEQPVNQQQAKASQQPTSQPWRRPSTCRRCGLSTKGHPPWTIR